MAGRIESIGSRLVSSLDRLLIPPFRLSANATIETQTDQTAAEWIDRLPCYGEMAVLRAVSPCFARFSRWLR
jgi:hypothetical protein